MANTQVDPIVEINDVRIVYLPSSVEATSGRGDKTVDALTAGDGVSDIAVSIDATTLKSMVKFKLKSIPASIALIKGWLAQDLNAGNAIRVTVPGISVDIYNNMHLLKDPVIPYSNTGEIEIDFEGLPAA